MRSYAQNREDVLLMRAFALIERGFYVDVGANDPVKESVTKAFYDRGWSGINVEPSAAWHSRLVDERLRDLNLNIAISDKPGRVRFFELRDSGLSTTIDKYAKRGAEQFAMRETEVDARTLTQVLDDAGVTEIHFLKVDVEGAEASVFRGLDLTKHRPWVIGAEAIEPLSEAVPSYADWEPILTAAGYTFGTFDGLNRWYVAAEHSELLPFFSFPADNYETDANAKRLADLEAELSAERVRSKSIQTRLAAAEQSALALRGSTSWRLTAPLRTIGQALKR